MASRVEISDDWEGEVTGALQKLFVERLGPAIAEDASRYCPEDTGALKESIEYHLEGLKLIVSATGGADGKTYAAYVELGTKPHVIYPKDKQALFWKGAAHPVGMVNHPGTKPRPFLRPALYKTRGDGGGAE
ncbi:hypothetical protein EDD90_2763 [Streptomyces sp. Ag109_O5-1]|uniref:HK97 gp10 family phage protein n=1 Tax=Streptomyces sp. Ag109_O5-1 TaxID=1938851 RepID=UPI000F4DEB9F|nr:HK97 gp10 family phage protein [Streptomyces sp. Ag109_O5-1]RPE39746.1 hypothetical protein EDD90_2763 [Streptomyces sp. Ag109_O5-1]